MSKLSLKSFTGCVTVTVIVALACAATFVRYVASEKRVDEAHELRTQSLFLADELHQSSDDLSRMAVAYVVTGDPSFRKHYRDILDVRDGRRARPHGFGHLYWDLVVSGDMPAPPDKTNSMALLDRIRALGLSQAEAAKMEEAKAKSDALVEIEERAMSLVAGMANPDSGERALALAMLHDARYFRGKADIMAPIDQFWGLIEQRTLDSVRIAERDAMTMRYTFVGIALALALMLTRTYLVLRRTLGASPDRVHDDIARLGSGDFSDEIPVRPAARDSVAGWLAEMQVKLAALSSEREKAIAQLRESEAKFRQLAESIREVFVLLDPAQKEVFYVSPAYEELWGRSCESLYREPTSWSDALHPDERDRVLAAISPGGRIGPFEVEFRIQRPDGSLRWVRMRGFPVRGEDGSIERIAGFAEDTTHRTKLEVVTREADRRYSDFVDKLDLPCVMANPAGRITYCNDRMVSLSGWNRFELLGRPAHELLAETGLIRRDGEVERMRWHHTPIHANDGGLVAAISLGVAA